MMLMKFGALAGRAFRHRWDLTQFCGSAMGACRWR
jgi:hypothetical protein